MSTVPQATQKGCPARPQRVKARGVPLGYVEGLNDARTLLADFFSSLLAGDSTSILRSSLNNLNGHRLPSQLLKDRVAFVPFTMPAIGIDVAGLSNIDEAAAPGVCAVLRKRR
jgi:hypothetical protein